MRVFIFSNLLLEFLGKSFNNDSHFESYARTLILTRAAWASLPPKRFSRHGKLETRNEKNGYSRRLDERERGIYVQKFRAYRIFPRFPFQLTDHATCRTSKTWNHRKTTLCLCCRRNSDEHYRPKYGFEPSKYVSKSLSEMLTCRLPCFVFFFRRPPSSGSGTWNPDPAFPLLFY